MTTQTIEHYRDLSDTSRLVASKPGQFWCYTHLQDLPLSQQSADPRYCHDCFKVLSDEWHDLKAAGKLRRAWWIPQTRLQGSEKPPERHKQAVTPDSVSYSASRPDVTDNSPVIAHCATCGAPLDGKRRDARYCGSDCRVKAHRLARSPQLVLALPEAAA